MSLTRSDLTGLALGPVVSQLLGIPYSDSAAPLTPDQARDIEDLLLPVVAQSPLPGKITFDQVLNELIAMDMPRAAIAGYRSLSEKDAAAFEHDFRVQFGMGICFMLSRQATAAKAFFENAVAIVPDEPAPYANLIQILIEDQAFSAAEEWLERGLTVAPNHMPLWECARFLFTEGQDLSPTEENELANRIQDLAERHDSWLGKVLGADLAEREPFDRLAVCQEYYDRGERSPEFLMEYTARLGMVADYQQIPKVVAEAKASQGSLPWQLMAHELEAYLAMEDRERARVAIDRFQGRQDLPTSAQKYIEDVKAEFYL